MSTSVKLVCGYKEATFEPEEFSLREVIAKATELFPM